MSACLLDPPLHATHLVGAGIRNIRRSTTHSAWPWRTARNERSIPSEPTGTSRLENCPDAIFTQILVFGGPTTIQTLATSSRSLRNRTNEDGHWKELYHHYGKGSSSDDEPCQQHSSWRERYETTLLVPVDVPSLGHAIRSLVRCSKPQTLPHRILIRSGDYDEEGTIDIPRNSHLTIQCIGSDQDNATLRLLNIAKNVNQPLIRVQSGASVFMANITLDHKSAGNDYWNGNAAIVCGTNRDALSFSSYGRPSQTIHEDATKLNLRDCMVSSQSGRGIMAVGEDVTVALERSSVQGCAATGIFVRCATVTLSKECRLEQNGQGSAEILPGQSSLFVDRGYLRVTNDCRLSGSVKSQDGRTNFMSVIPSE